MWFGGSSASSARSAGDIGVHCANNLSTLACYFPADSADYAEEYSFAALFRRERLFGVAVLCFGFCLRLSARSAGDLLGFFVQ